jgi:hypothetical protein
MQGESKIGKILQKFFIDGPLSLLHFAATAQTTFVASCSAIVPKKVKTLWLWLRRE